MAFRVFGRSIGSLFSGNDAAEARARQLAEARRRAEEARQRAVEQQRRALEAQKQAEEAKKKAAQERAELERIRTTGAPRNELDGAITRVRDADTKVRTTQSAHSSAQSVLNNALREVVVAERAANEEARAAGKPEPFAATRALPDQFDPAALDTAERARLLGLTSQAPVTLETAEFAADIRHGDEEQIVQALSGRTPEELRSIREAYLEHYGEEIEKRVGDEVGEDRGRALLAGDPVGADAALLHQSLHREKSFLGIGRHDTDEDRVLESLAAMPPEQLERVKADYEKRYGRSLEGELQEFLEGSDADRARAYVTGDVPMGTAIALHEDPDKAVELLRTLDPAQRKSVDEAYARQYGKPLSGDRAELDVPDAQRAELEALLTGDDATARATRISASISRLEEATADAREELREDGRSTQHVELAGDEFTELSAEVHAALEGTTPEQRAAISERFEQLSGRPLQQALDGNLPNAREREKGMALLQNGALDPLQTVRYAATGEEVDMAAVRSVLKPMDKAQVDALARAWEAQYGGSMKGALEEELGDRETFEVGMLLRGRPQNGVEALERLTEVRDFERGNWFSRTALDAFSDSGERLDAEVDRATLYADLARSDGTMSADEDRQLQALTGFGEQEVQETQESKDRVAQNVAVAATTVAAVGVTVATGGTAAGVAAAAVAGAAARVGSRELIEGNTYSTREQGLNDAAIGAAEGAFSAVGAGVATRALGTSARSVAGMATVGAAAGGSGSAGVTAVNTQTWQNGVGSGLRQVGTSAAIGTVAGAATGGAMAAVGGRLASRAAGTAAHEQVASSAQTTFRIQPGVNPNALGARAVTSGNRPGTSGVASAESAVTADDVVTASVAMGAGHAGASNVSSSQLLGLTGQSLNAPSARPAIRPATRPAIQARPADLAGQPRATGNAGTTGPTVRLAGAARSHAAASPTPPIRLMGSSVDESAVDALRERGTRMGLGFDELKEIEARARAGLGTPEELAVEINQRAAYNQLPANGPHGAVSPALQEDVLRLQPLFKDAHERVGLTAHEAFELQTRVSRGITSFHDASLELQQRVQARLPRPPQTARPGAEHATSHTSVLRNINQTARDLDVDIDTLQRLHQRVLQTPENPAELKKVMDEVWDEMLYNRPIPNDLPADVGETLVEAAARDSGMTAANVDGFMHRFVATPDEVARTLRSFGIQRARRAEDVVKTRELWAGIERAKQNGTYPPHPTAFRPDHVPLREHAFETVVERARALGLPDEAFASQAVGVYNYPQDLGRVLEGLKKTVRSNAADSAPTPTTTNRITDRAKRAAARQEQEALVQAQQAELARNLAEAEKARKLGADTQLLFSEGRAAGIDHVRLGQFNTDLANGTRPIESILADVRRAARPTAFDRQFFGAHADTAPIPARAYANTYAQLRVPAPATLSATERQMFQMQSQNMLYSARHMGSRSALDDFAAQLESSAKQVEASVVDAARRLPPEAGTEALRNQAAMVAGMRHALTVIRSNPDAVLKGNAIAGY